MQTFFFTSKSAEFVGMFRNKSLPSIQDGVWRSHTTGAGWLSRSISYRLSCLWSWVPRCEDCELGCGCWTKSRGKTPQIIHLFIGFGTIIFHPSILGFFPLFLETPILWFEYTCWFEKTEIYYRWIWIWLLGYRWVNDLFRWGSFLIYFVSMGLTSHGGSFLSLWAWKMSFLLGRPPARCELLVLGRVIVGHLSDWFQLQKEGPSWWCFVWYFHFEP